VRSRAPTPWRKRCPRGRFGPITVGGPSSAAVMGLRSMPGRDSLEGGVGVVRAHAGRGTIAAGPAVCLRGLVQLGSRGVLFGVLVIVVADWCVGGWFGEAGGGFQHQGVDECLG